MCWYGVPSLPKLDYGSEELRERMYGGPTSVVRRWLEPPYDLDGWRIDVANMTGRLGATDHLLEVASGVRSAAAAVRPDALVVGEHAHDARADLRAGALARHDELRGLHAPGVGVAARRDLADRAGEQRLRAPGRDPEAAG